ncbi:MAG: fibronectin type III domain-containing protein [Caldilineaceae bacterium]|nr:fibronectin type III domain-containing protein [Caldilineaceae bacterium]
MIKGTRYLLRSASLALLALTLMVAMALPSSAADDECSPSQMLDEVEIVSVAAKEAPASWSAQDLVKFEYDGDIENGLLEVSFKDIPTDFDFDGYIIKAVPGDDDPGNSYKFVGKDGYTSPSLIARPSVVGSTVTEILNLEPGTKYYVTIYAVNHNTVQISPDQRAQDSSAATTLLSAPFLGALDWKRIYTEDEGANEAGSLCAASITSDACGNGWYSIGLYDPEYEGTHFSFYTADQEAGQHYFRWLKPTVYGPFDHTILTNDDENEADMLSYDKDGEVETDCDDEGGDCGHTHYQFRAVDSDGDTVASELVETNGNFSEVGDFYQVVFSAEEGDLTLSVSLGRMVGGKYKAMSDTASVMFEAPDDLRALDQTYEEYNRVNMDITSGITKDDGSIDKDDIESYLDSVFTVISSGDIDTDQEKMTAYLNNQLK